MIVGLGVDIAEIPRIEAAIGRYGDHLLHRLFTAAEIDYCESYRNRFERYAGRFAVKEAAMKALGTGWRRGVRWVDIEVVREPTGKPTLRLSGQAGMYAEQLGVRNIAVSITHSGNTALAQVIFES
jgi:holo-[acyl-carrier protein] synthase